MQVRQEQVLRLWFTQCLMAPPSKQNVRKQEISFLMQSLSSHASFLYKRASEEKKIIGLFGGCCRVNNKELLWCDQKGLLGTAQNHLHFVWSLAGLEYKAFLFSRLRFLVQIPLDLNRYLRPLYQMMPKSSKWVRHTPNPCEFENWAG